MNANPEAIRTLSTQATLRRRLLSATRDAEAQDILAEAGLEVADLDAALAPSAAFAFDPGDILFPDNPKRRNRIQELNADVGSLAKTLADQIGDIERLSDEFTAQQREIIDRLALEPDEIPAELTDLTEITFEDVVIRSTQIVGPLFFFQRAGAALTAAAAARNLVNGTSAIARFRAIFSLPASSLIKYIGGAVVVTAAFELIVGAAVGAAARTKLREGIRDLIAPRQALQLAELVNGELVQTLASLVELQKILLDTGLDVETLTAAITRRLEVAEEAIGKIDEASAVKHLMDLDTFRGSYTNEDHFLDGEASIVAAALVAREGPFVDAVLADEGLQSRLLMARDDDEVIAIARAAGFPLTREALDAEYDAVVMTDLFSGLFESWFYPDNPKRERRANELSEDIGRFAGELADVAERVRGTATRLGERFRALVERAGGDPAAYPFERVEFDEVGFDVAAIFAPFLTIGAVRAPLSKAVSAALVRAGQSSVSVLSRVLGLPGFVKLSGGAVTAVAFVAFDAIFGAIFGAVKRGRYREAIQGLIGPRQAVRKAIEITRALDRQLGALADNFDVYETLGLGLDDLEGYAAGRLADFEASVAAITDASIAEALESLDRMRGSWIDEDALTE